MWRSWLALWRLLCCFALGCFLILFTGLALRQVREDGWGLDYPLPPAGAPAGQIPFLGVNVELGPLSSAARRGDLARLRATGFGWARQRFDWAQLEPAPDQPQWAASDELLAALAEAGLVPVAVVDGSPAWARASADVGVNDNPLAPPADSAAFARFAGRFAARYGEQVRFYQLWDEPNIAPHWGNRHIDPVAYAQLVQAAAITIRQADPDAVILLAALAPTADRGHTAIDEVYFLQRLYAAGAAPYFDAVAVQSFGFGLAPADERERLSLLNFQRVKLIRRTMLAAGDGATPLWLVRYGWNTRPDSPWGVVTPAVQTQFASEALTVASQWPWLSAIGWMVDRPAAAPTDAQWGFALTAELARVTGRWQRPPPPANAPGARVHSAALVWSLALAAAVILVWRAWAAAMLLSWSRWARAWRTLPWPLRLAGWLALGIVYFVATWSPLILLCWLVAALLIAAEPLTGLRLAALLLPFTYQHKELRLGEFSWTLAPAVVVTFCLAPALCRGLWSARRQRSWQFGRSEWLGLLWLVINLLAAFNVWHWPAYGQGLLELVVIPLVLYLAVRSLVRRRAQWEQILLALLTGGLVVAAGGLLSWWRGQGVMADGVLRLVGFAYSPNHTALYLERTLLLGVGLSFAAGPGRRRWGLVIATLVIALALVLTASRGALLLGVPLALAVLGWLVQRRFRPRWLRWRPDQRPARIVLGLLLVLVVVTTWSLLMQPALWERIGNSETLLSRVRIWQETVHLWQDYPLLGVGVGGFFWRYPAYLTGAGGEPNILHPHNVWLEFAATVGLLGIVWLGGLIFCVIGLAQAISNAQDNRVFWLSAALVAGLSAGLAHAQVDTFALLPDLAMWNWLALGLLAGAESRFAPVQAQTGPQ